MDGGEQIITRSNKNRKVVLTDTQRETADVLSKNALPKNGEVIGGQRVEYVRGNGADIIAKRPSEVKNTIYFRTDLEDLFNRGEVVSFSKYPKDKLVVHSTTSANDQATLDGMKNKDYGIAVLKNGAAVIGRHPRHGSIAAGPLAMIDSDPATLEHSVNVECTAEMRADNKDTVEPNPDQMATITRVQ